MKLKIKIKKLEGDINPPKIIKKGDWIDLRAAEDVQIAGPSVTQSKKERKVEFNSAVVPLGVAMQLPEGYEAVVNVRSSAYKNYQVMLANSQGVIDNSYNGDGDQWFAHLVAFNDVFISKGDRICQFRIQLSQMATVWQKLKWLFSSGIEIEMVDKLNKCNRGGHGSTGNI